MALDIIPGNPDLVDQAFADLKADLDGEKAARLTAQIEIDVLSRAVKDPKISTDKFATQIPTLEDKVKHLVNKVVDGLNEVQARELCLERTTRANGDYQKQISQLTKKLESKSFGHFQNAPIPFNLLPTDLASAHRIRCRA
jgi:chromosome segregation ATPase